MPELCQSAQIRRDLEDVIAVIVKDHPPNLAATVIAGVFTQTRFNITRKLTQIAQAVFQTGTRYAGDPCH